ncbi:MAG TPA: ribbon-helix-helix protein, CopG family [Methanobacteriaceae archaeon]|jgi:predicted transcriptional regulator|nr:ribbon-helix-helix protein, CopG family [Euryarchaeota archaeon]HNR26800.1 ribbon-helix-helix protein, CopG family [Methanobacteriaceae archaeon]HNS26035.1 ribbon-helix-helix protein, CopG family [Methanobacteriaceae archaeon]
MAKKSVYIRLEPEYVQRIDELAQKQDRSRSYIMRQLVIKGLGKMK